MAMDTSHFKEIGDINMTNDVSVELNFEYDNKIKGNADASAEKPYESATPALPIADISSNSRPDERLYNKQVSVKEL